MLSSVLWVTTLICHSSCYFIPLRRNLTYKTISWLSWVNDWCPGTAFIAKIDDDTVVNPFNLRLYLNKHLRQNPSPQNIHGQFMARNKAMRTNKYAVTEVSVWPLWSKW